MNKYAGGEEAVQNEIERVFHITLHMLIVGKVEQPAVPYHVVVKFPFESGFERRTELVVAFSRGYTECRRVHIVVDDELQVIGERRE